MKVEVIENRMPKGFGDLHVRAYLLDLEGASINDLFTALGRAKFVGTSFVGTIHDREGNGIYSLDIEPPRPYGDIWGVDSGKMTLGEATVLVLQDAGFNVTYRDVTYDEVD